MRSIKEFYEECKKKPRSIFGHIIVFLMAVWFVLGLWWLIGLGIFMTILDHDEEKQEHFETWY